MPSKSNRVALFCIVTAFYWFSLYTYVPTLATYSESLGASYKLVGLIIGSYGFTQMLLRIPLGIVSDRLNRRKVFVIMGIALGFTSSLGMWSSMHPALLLVFRSVSGAAAAAWVPFTVLFSSYYDSKEAPRAIGFISAITSLGQMVAILLGGIAAQQINARAPFLLAFLGAAVGIGLSFGVAENKAIHREPVKMKNLLVVARDPRLLFFSGLAVISQYMTFATMYGFTPVAAKQLGADSFQLGLLTALSTMPGIFAAALSGSFFAKRVGERRTLTAGFALAAICCISVPLIPHLSLLYVTQMINGFCLGTVFPLLMGLCIRNVEEGRRATAMGFFQAIYGIGMFMGPMMVGFLSDTAGLATGFLSTGAVGLLGAGLAFWKICRKTENLVA